MIWGLTQRERSRGSDPPRAGKEQPGPPQSGKHSQVWGETGAFQPLGLGLGRVKGRMPESEKPRALGSWGGFELSFLTIRQMLRETEEDTRNLLVPPPPQKRLLG